MHIAQARHEESHRFLLLQAAGESDRARLHAAAAPGSGLFLLARPAGQCKMSDRELSLALRLRLGLPPAQFLPSHCKVCNGADGDLGLDPWHALSCSHLRALSHTQRHDAIASTLHRWCRERGAESKWQPRNIDKDADLIPDLEVTWGAHRFLVDVSIRHPAARSNVARGSTGQLKVASQAAREKVRKYEELAAGSRAEFVPFVLESFGGWCTEAADFVRRLTKMARIDDPTWDTNELLSDLRVAISVTLQKWNAHATFKSIAASGLAGL
jgi:hypothetical protein